MPLQESHKLPYREFISFSERSQLACKIRNLALDSTKKWRRKFKCIGWMWWFFQTSVKGNFTNYHGNLTLKRFAGPRENWPAVKSQDFVIVTWGLVQRITNRQRAALLQGQGWVATVPGWGKGQNRKSGCRRERYVNFGGRKGRALRCHENVWKLTSFPNSDLSSCSYSTALWTRDS